MRAVPIAALAAVCLAVTAGDTASPTEVGGSEIIVDNFAFAPERITVMAGTKVTWINRDEAPHTAVSVTRSFRSPPLDTGDAFSFAFAVPGVYDYFCTLHPQMKGSIVVEASPKQE